MKKQPALSPIGIAIAIVMLLALLMIVSAPVIVDNTKKDSGKSHVNYNQERIYQENYERERHDIESLRNEMSETYKSQIQYLESKISNMELQMQQLTDSSQAGRRKYFCTLEGALDSNGENVQITKEVQQNPNTKYIFVCGKNQF